MSFVWKISCALVFLIGNAYAQSKTSTFDAKMQNIALSEHINLQNATMKQSESGVLCQALASTVIQQAKDKQKDSRSEKQGEDYCVFHIVRWSEPDVTTHLQSVQQEHWYLYAPHDSSDEAYTINKRLMGVRSFYFFYIHINRAGGPTHKLPMDAANKPLVNEFRPSYDVKITKKLAANVQHLISLASQFGSSAKVKQIEPLTSAQPFMLGKSNKYDSEFAGGSISDIYNPSDIEITPSANAVPQDADSNPAGSGPTQTVSMGAKQTYDDEGKYFFDFSIAVPVRKISETTIDFSSFTATPVNADGTNAFMILDGYFPPNDVKTNGWRWTPHPIAGLAFAKRPASKIMIGAALGPKFSELYIGALLVKQPKIVGSNSCKAPTPSMAIMNDFHYCPQFTIGVNLPVAAIASRLGSPK